MKYKIYKLIYNELVVYIGRTIQTLERRKRGPYPFIPFIKKCKMELIEETDDLSRERFWISYHRSINPLLLNKEDGDGITNYKEYFKEWRIKNHKEVVDYYTIYNNNPVNKARRKKYYQEKRNKK